MNNPLSFRPKLTWAALICLLSFSCAHSGPATVSAGGSTSSGSTNFAIEDLDGDWVGTLSPDSSVVDPFNFYFSSAAGGVVSEAADSKSNQWLDIDSQIVANLLTDGEVFIEFDSMMQQSRLLLEGNMNEAMNELSGTYEYVNYYDITANGTFLLARSTGVDFFDGLDFSGTWTGGLGIGVNENKRQVTFVLDSNGDVISGEMTNYVSGLVLHSYSAGAGSFAITNTATGRIDGMTLVADDGAIAEFDTLLVDRDLTLIGGVGTDTDYGVGFLEVRR